MNNDLMTSWSGSYYTNYDIGRSKHLPNLRHIGVFQNRRVDEKTNAFKYIYT